MTDQRKGISSRPDKQVESGGLISSGEVEVIDAEYTDKWVYPGTTTTATGLIMTLRDQNGEDHTGDFWSCGDAKNVEVSKDGNYIYALAGQEGFPRGCNLSLLYDSMESGGYPRDKHPEDGHVRNLLIGLCMTVVRVEQKKRDGLQAVSRSGRPLMTLHCNKVISLPWEKKKSTTAGKSATKGKTNAAPSQEDVDEKAAALLMAIVGEKGTVNRKEIGMLAYQHASMKGDPHRNVYSGRISKPEFLESEKLGCGTLWSFDGDSGEIGAQA